MVVHEQTYNGYGISAFIHRKRLNQLYNLFKKVDFKQSGKLADFGCSNGHVISLLQRDFFNNKPWKFYGFDHSTRLLELAKAKNLKDTQFYFFDLNKIKF